MGAGQQGDEKHSMAILWMIGGIFLLGAIIWWAFAPQLKQFFIFLRTIELRLIYWVIKWLPFEQIKLEVYSALYVLSMVTPSNLSLPLAESASNLTGEFFRWPFSILLLFFMYLTYVRNVKMRYKKRYDMELLTKQECSEWPQINPVLNLDLVATDLDQGPWAMGMPPMLFCKVNRLLQIAVDTSGGFLQKGPMFKAKLIPGKADELFSNQLGRLWHGAENMPIHRRALFAAFVARGCRDSTAAKELIDQINRSCRGGNLSNLNFSGADELWKKHYNDKLVQNVVNAHAYEFTIFTAALLFAREDGVFACADFLWLKPLDRRLWYVLTNVGRQTPYCEAAGVHAHFLAERKLRRKLTTPVIKEAVRGLEIALNEIIYTPSEEEKQALLQQAQA